MDFLKSYCKHTHNKKGELISSVAASIHRQKVYRIITLHSLALVFFVQGILPRYYWSGAMRLFKYVANGVIKKARSNIAAVYLVFLTIL